jgi:hypothetical protein
MSGRWVVPWSVLASLCACGDDTGASIYSSSAASASLTSDPGTETTASSNGSSPGDGDGDPITTTSPGDGDGDSGGIKLDTLIPDLPAGGNPIIPTNCAQAEVGESTVGCLFYAVDLDQVALFENGQFGVAVSNVQASSVAIVRVEKKANGLWVLAAPAQMVDPLDLFVFALPDMHHQGSGIAFGGAYRIVSDVPIIAYQFNPFEKGAWSTDASLLYPVASWDTLNHVIAWPDGSGRGYVTIVAQVDGTVVEVTPSVATAAGNGVPAGSPGTPFMLNLEEGDIAEIMVANDNTDLTGTRISSDDPVAVFTAHECAFIPDLQNACDHIEEQVAGLHLWGTNFVAARVPPRTPMAPETALWQIYASEDDTTITLASNGAVTGLPQSPAQLDRGQKLEFYAGGSASNPGDFLVSADKPIALFNYMTGYGNLPLAQQTGDPAVVQLSPIEQFLPTYVIVVPDKWDTDQLVITRKTGQGVLLDGVALADSGFAAVGPDHEVGRFIVADGVHELHGPQGFSVVVVGYDYADSYAYLGGSGTGLINPEPQG